MKIAELQFLRVDMASFDAYRTQLDKLWFWWKFYEIFYLTKVHAILQKVLRP
jgi:hypothetical protein